MSFLLDTSVIIPLSRNEKSMVKVMESLRLHAPENPSVPLMAYAEFYEGLLAKNEKNMERMLSFLNTFNLQIPSRRTAEIIARLRIRYQEHGKMLPLADLFIAAQAIESGMVLVTRDEGFRKIKELGQSLIIV